MAIEDLYEELGRLRAEVDQLKRQWEYDQGRIAALEADRLRLVTVGGVMAFILTCVGMFFADVVRHTFAKLIN